jgi:ADP-heptose:LPS heptosyltransferase
VFLPLYGPFMPKRCPFDIKSIGVIVGLDLVGDALIKLPFVRALREAFPQAQIHWITGKGPTAYNGPLREVTRRLIDVIHEQPEWLPNTERQAQASAPRFDLLIDTRNRWNEARLVRKSVPHALFLASAARFLASERRPSLFSPRPPHLVDRLLQYVELAAGSVPCVTSRLPVPDIPLAKAKQLLPQGSVYAGLAPGAGNPVKIWPRERFAELAVLQAAKGRKPVFLLGPQEQDWLPALKEAVPSALFPLQARKVWGTPGITIEQTLALGSLLNVAVANDSGTGHMLAVVDCPLISLFGPTSPAKLAPRVSRGAVIRAQDFGKDGMDAIPVEVVNDVVNRLLSS